ncbi:transmembrane protein 154 [Parambassis ranga]|uniref:Transmembrane protein 154-like n=1 Tax=Parambassis ranga TaxID=210632 RepID=A0A6P7IBC9_9TELE|nr:transmembrane protein 154-like [Parambassis ranga]XP_028273948.1 transmembrane protein 154-like [Parambassis ranga]
MSASWPGNMRGPQMKTPLLLLLLLLLLLVALTGTASSDPPRSEGIKGNTSSGVDTFTNVTDAPRVTNVTTTQDEEQDLNPFIIMIPVVLVVVIIGMIVCGIFISRWCTKKVGNQELSKEDPYLDGSSTEKVPMPMFEEDVPSVMELEMEELDQWMKKDTETAEDSNEA